MGAQTLSIFDQPSSKLAPIIVMDSRVRKSSIQIVSQHISGPTGCIKRNSADNHSGCRFFSLRCWLLSGIQFHSPLSRAFFTVLAKDSATFVRIIFLNSFISRNYEFTVTENSGCAAEQRGRVVSGGSVKRFSSASITPKRINNKNRL